MCKFIGKSNERILCKLSKSEILRLYSIVHVAMETTKTSHFTCQSKSFISIFFTCQVSACELQPFSCHYLANEIYSQTAKTVFSHLNNDAKPPKWILPEFDVSRIRPRLRGLPHLETFTWQNLTLPWEGYPVWQTALPALAGHSTYYVNVIKLRWEVTWTGALPHLAEDPTSMYTGPKTGTNYEICIIIQII